MRRIGVAGLILLFPLITAVPARALTANDPGLDRQWGMKLIGAPAAWAVNATGAGITIAVVDTGVDLHHEDLQANVAGGGNMFKPGTSAQDDKGHGSHVAGIAAAVTGNATGVTGVAPRAAIMPVKVLDSSGTSGSTPSGNSTVDEGIRYAADNGAQVINLSLGPDVSLPALDMSGVESAIEYAWAKGVVCVLAAGNDSLPLSGYRTVHALVVTAVDRNDKIASYATDIGAARWGIAAPGGAADGTAANDILSTYWVTGKANSYGTAAGTSMATPHVAGAAAILRSLGLTPQQTIDRLLATAKDLGPAGTDTTYGAGRLDIAKAIEGLAVPGPDAAPPTTAPSSNGSPAPTTAARTPTARRPATPAAPTPAAPTTTATPPRGCRRCDEPAGRRADDDHTPKHHRGRVDETVEAFTPERARAAANWAGGTRARCRDRGHGRVRSAASPPVSEVRRAHGRAVLATRARLSCGRPLVRRARSWSRESRAR